MSISHCICALALSLTLTLTGAPANSQDLSTEQTRRYTVFLGGMAVGVENVLVTVEGGELIITSQGRLDAPLNVDLRLAEVRYAADGSPRRLAIESMVNGTPSLLETRFNEGVATSSGIEGDVNINRSDPVSLRPVVLSTGFFGAYEAVTRRLINAEVDTELRAYIAPLAEVIIRLTAVATETVQTPTSTLELRRLNIVIVDPAGELAMSLSTGPTGELMRLMIPDQSLEFVRNDLASPLTRTVGFTNPGDERATIPADGFSLGATLTQPTTGLGLRPAVVLLSNAGDRDGTLNGVPTLTHIAGALAEAGFISVRYDRRGTGQSGGRVESATLHNYSEDVRSAFDWLEDRNDIDRDQIALLGVGDGAWIALQAAADERDIAAVVSISAPSVSGAEFVLEQQEQRFNEMGLSQDERVANRELQLRIHDAVLTGDGWDELEDDIRQQADSPWFQSYLSFDPAEVLEDVRSPLLFLAGSADELVGMSHAQQLGAIAREENRVSNIEVITIEGMNNELGVTGAVPGVTINQELITTVITWLSTTIAR